MKALVVGAGRMGGFHARVLRDLGLDVTTVDPDPAAGADHLRVPPRHFDVVCIATPIAQLAGEAARWAGHEGWLLVEKPMAANVRHGEILQALFDGQRVAVGYVERFNPQVAVLRETIYERGQPDRAYFQRLNNRPSLDLPFDLRSHDVDLARHLGLDCWVSYLNTDEAVQRVRRVTLTYGLESVVVDLMAHSSSPLHAQWRAFLGGQQGYATPADAVHVLAMVERQAALVTA